jgi:glycosyltransferase involved in cell wall biosynthesis
MRAATRVFVFMKLKVCLDARLVSGFGGIEQFVIGLASGLSTLRDGPEEFVFLTYDGQDDWLRPYITGPCSILSIKPAHEPLWKRFVRNSSIWKRLGHLAGRASVRLPISDGTIERAAIDVMHFTFPNGFLTDVPSIYNPHDLQHLHLPDYFTQRERLAREVILRAMCNQARIVAVASSWTKCDLLGQYGLQLERVVVVPLAPAIDAYGDTSEEDFTATSKKFELPDAFILYPAQTWKHKNHLGLIEALAKLRDSRGLSIPLICSGAKNEFYSVIERRVRELRMEEQVKFLGFVAPLELKALYRLARCVVIPTKFEAASFPLWEAFSSGTPAACSNVTSLPEQAGDSALVFDPNNCDQIANAIEPLWTDEALRARLTERGRNNVARFSWNRTAKLYRSLYRYIANREVLPSGYTLTGLQQ